MAIFDGLSKLLGVSDKAMESFMTGDGLMNLMKGGMGIYNGMKMGDMMDFQKGLAQQQMGMQRDAFNMQKEDRQKAQNLDWTQGYADEYRGG